MSLDSNKIKRFISRLLIYQIVLLWPYMKLINLDSQFPDFKEKLFQNFSYFGIENETLFEYAQDPNCLVLLSFVEIISGIFAIFGSFNGNLISAVLFILNCLIYFNPLFQTENHITLYGTRNEIMYNIGILFSILLCTFYPYDRNSESLGRIISSKNFNEDLPESKISNEYKFAGKNKKRKNKNQKN